MVDGPVVKYKSEVRAPRAARTVVGDSRNLPVVDDHDQSRYHRLLPTVHQLSNYTPKAEQDDVRGLS